MNTPIILKRKKPSAKVVTLSMDAEDKLKFQIPTSVVDPVQNGLCFYGNILWCNPSFKRRF